MSQTPPTGPPSPNPEGPKKLLRAANDRYLGGVCGGLAVYLNLDPLVVRLLMVVAAIFSFPIGPGIYAIMWAVVPKENL